LRIIARKVSANANAKKMPSSSHSSYDERYDEDDDHPPHTGKVVHEHEPEPEGEQAEEDETGGAETESEQASLKTWMNVDEGA